MQHFIYSSGCVRTPCWSLMARLWTQPLCLPSQWSLCRLLTCSRWVVHQVHTSQFTSTLNRLSHTVLLSCVFASYNYVFIFLSFFCFLPSSPVRVQTSSNKRSVWTSGVLASEWTGSNSTSAMWNFVLISHKGWRNKWAIIHIPRAVTRVEYDSLWNIRMLSTYREISGSTEDANHIEGSFSWKKNQLSHHFQWSLYPNVLLNSPPPSFPRPRCLFQLSRPLLHVPCPPPSHLYQNPPTQEASMSTQPPSSLCMRYAFYWNFCGKQGIRCILNQWGK